MRRDNDEILLDYYLGHREPEPEPDQFRCAHAVWLRDDFDGTAEYSCGPFGPCPGWDRCSRSMKREREATACPPPRTFTLIYADFPWDYSRTPAIAFRGCRRSTAASHYRVMTLDEGLAMRPLFDQWADPDGCELWEWTTGPKMPEAAALISGWGFRWVTVGMVWGKQYPRAAKRQGGMHAEDLTCGMGYGPKTCVEFLIHARRGRPIVARWKNRSVRQLQFAIRRQHSRKPELFRRLLEEAYPGARRLELFARSRAEGWAVWGDQVDRFASGESEIEQKKAQQIKGQRLLFDMEEAVGA